MVAVAAGVETVAGIEVRGGPGDTLIVETTGGDRFVPKMMELLSGDGASIPVTSISLSHPTLEDVFIKLTGHAIRAGEAESDIKSMVKMWRGMGRR